MRKVPPPDFRYVWLSPDVWLAPGATSEAAVVAMGTIGIAGLGVGLWNAGYEPLSLALSLGASAAALAAMRADRRPASRGAREVPMAIVPWGVLVTPDTDPRILRWSAVRRVEVDVVHTLRGGTPAVLSSLVTVVTDTERLAGRAPGSVGLERLTVDLDAYAEESQRPVSVDLEGTRAVASGPHEPVMEELMLYAQALCSTREGEARLELPTAGYRTAALRTAGPETASLLRAVLADGREAPLEPRVQGALVAGLLGARDVLPSLSRLAGSPHPLVAAASRAAAIRLGAAPNRVGAVREVSAFLVEEDLEALERFAVAV